MTQRGSGAVSVVIVLLLIVALSYVGASRLARPSESATADSPATAVDNTKAFACASNRQTAEREVQMWLVNHPGETPTLEAVGSAAHCPTGGTYRLDGLEVFCSAHP